MSFYARAPPSARDRAPKLEACTSENQLPYYRQYMVRPKPHLRSHDTCRLEAAYFKPVGQTRQGIAHERGWANAAGKAGTRANQAEVHKQKYSQKHNAVHVKYRKDAHK